jgi:hypothetical protein
MTPAALENDLPLTAAGRSGESIIYKAMAARLRRDPVMGFESQASSQVLAER